MKTYTKDQEETIRVLAKYEWFHEILSILFWISNWCALMAAMYLKLPIWLIGIYLIFAVFSSWKTPLNKYLEKIQ